MRLQTAVGDLTYAANDAKELGGALKRRLEAARDEQGNIRYERVFGCH